MDGQLETARLALREMRREDADALHAMQAPRSYWEHQAVEPRSREETGRYLDEYLKRRGPDEDRRLVFLAAAAKADGRLVGHASLMVCGVRTATLSYGVAEAFHRQGFGTEIARRMLEFGFAHMRLHRIRAEATADHTASIRLLERIGMVREGVCRDCIFARGRWWTEAQYAILEEDFRARAGMSDSSPDARSACVESSSPGQAA